MADVGKPLDWDTAEVEDSGEFILLEEGVYPYTVTELERSYYAGSAKLPACPQANLMLAVDSQRGTATIGESLFLCQKTAWKIAKFFVSIGMQRKGDGKVPVDWDLVEGAQGWALFGVREYTRRDGGTAQASTVEEWLAPDDPRVHAAIQAMQRPAAAQDAWSM